MLDETLARLRAHGDNIRRYRWLLDTHLTELERDFIEKRLAEEQLVFQALAESTLPSMRQFRQSQHSVDNVATERARRNQRG